MRKTKTHNWKQECRPQIMAQVYGTPFSQLKIQLHSFQQWFLNTEHTLQSLRFSKYFNLLENWYSSINVSRHSIFSALHFLMDIFLRTIMNK